MPPQNQQSQGFGFGAPLRHPSQLNIPPPPPQYDKPVLSATFIPGGDSFGPGVGIPPLDFSNFSYYEGPVTSEPSRSSLEQKQGGTYNPHSYSYPNPAQHNYEIANRENRAASASSKLPPLQKREGSEPISPGPPTATRIPPDLDGSSGRQRAQSAAVGQSLSPGLSAQWPLDRVTTWLGANGFSPEWQETFRTLNIEGSNFFDLGKGATGRGNLGKMHQQVYPQLAKICSNNGRPWDQSREREEGKRLRKLITRIGDDGPSSAGSGHRRRESGLPSASTDGGLESSPNLGQSEFAGGTSPGKSTPHLMQSGFGSRNSQNRSSTLPVFSKHSSTSSTPSESRHPESLHSNHRATLNNIGARGLGRHSPNLSGDGSSLAPRNVDASPSSSPGLGHAMPTSATSQHSRSSHFRNDSNESAQKSSTHGRGGLNVPASASDNLVPTDRFYEQQSRRDVTDGVRPGLDGSRTHSGETAPSISKGFLSKLMRKRHDTSQALEEQSGESPTSPGPFKSIFAKPSANNSDTALALRPSSAAAADGESHIVRPRRGTRTSKKFIFVTPDHWNYRLVDVTGIDDVVSLRKLLCFEIGLLDSDSAQLFLTEAGQTDHESPVSDGLLASVQSQADNLGTVKVFVQSGAMSAIAATQGTGMGISFSQRAAGGQPMVKANSAGGLIPLALQQNQSPEDLAKATEDYRKQTEAKQRAYFESRQSRKESNKNTIIDFDSPRASPFEEKKTDTLVPLRKPPTAPAESNTLTKVNSLRAKTGSGNRASFDALKRLSNPISEEDLANDGKRNSQSSSLGQGIGAALVNAGKMGASPAAAFQGHQRTRGSVRFGPKGNTPGDAAQHLKLYGTQNSAAQNLELYGRSQDLPENGERPGLQNRKSFGPNFEFQETNVSFAPSPRPPPANDDDDDDSDDGLFAIPLSTKGTMTKTSERPALTVNTDQHVKKTKVAFKSPASSGGMSFNRNSTDGSASANGDRFDRTNSDGSFSGSAQSPDDRMGRRESFVSDNWASRPAVENVVDKLDEFFPGVDLDRPFMEEAPDGAVSGHKLPEDQLSATLRGRVTYGTEGLPLDFTKNESDTLGSDESTLRAQNKDKIASVAQRQVEKSGGLGRMKSIRQVAQKRNDIPRGPSVRHVRGPSVVQPQASGIVRRKSTKMFGANIVQIKPQPGKRVSTLDPIPQEEVPDEDQPTRQATFKIIRGQLIGKGTYGRVYLGMNATTGEFLAVKQVEVNQKVAGQDKDRIKEMVGALDQEIETMKDLEHPNIVQYLGCERKEMSISIYLEYISGGSIGSCLRKHGKFEEPVVRSLTRQTLQGLAYLHEEGILHRDLKADNILLDLDGSCKISDFGISKKSDNIYGNDVTNSMQGSVFWMAPEVVRSQGQGYSAKIDIWSLGCVVLEMFAGKRPWSREEAIGAIFKLGNLNQAPPIPDDVSATASVDGLNFMYDCFQM